MNLYDQLVIVVYELDMEGETPAGKEFGVLVMICSIQMLFWVLKTGFI